MSDPKTFCESRPEEISAALDDIDTRLRSFYETQQNDPLRHKFDDKTTAMAFEFAATSRLLFDVKKYLKRGDLKTRVENTRLGLAVFLRAVNYARLQMPSIPEDTLRIRPKP